MRSRVPLALIALALVSWLLIDAGTVWARAGGGGSRGSRSYSAPARPPPVAPANPATPSRGIAQPTPQPAPQRPGFFGSLMGGIAGFALGGLLGSLLFGGGFGGGIGLLEILLVVGGVFLLMRMIRGRQSAPEPAYAGAGASAYGASDPGGSGDRKSTRLNSSHVSSAYAVFCLNKTKSQDFFPLLFYKEKGNILETTFSPAK